MSRRLAVSVLLLAVLYLRPPQAPTASRAGGKLRDDGKISQARSAIHTAVLSALDRQ